MFYRISFIIIIFMCSLGEAKGPRFMPGHSSERVVDSEYSIGDGIDICEYGSLTCHVCADFYKNILPKLLKDFPGKLKIIVRPFPFSKVDVAGARIVLYSKDPHGLTLEFYKRQDEWINAKDQILAMEKIAEDFGMSRADIEASQKDGHLENVLLARRLIFQSKAAPIFKVGKSILPGLPHYESFKKVLEEFLDWENKGNPVDKFDALAAFSRLAKENDHEKK